MKVYYPAYYHQFQCLAGACPDSCCKEWTVDIDPETAARYRALPGALGVRLRQCLQHTGDGTVLAIENGRCPMWQSDGLCRIQAELGHHALSRTCREFPRLRHDYGDFMELGLELSCPEAARLIFSQPGDFLEQTVPGETEAEYDSDLMTLLRSSRRAALALIESRQHPLPRLLAALLLYGHKVQAQIDGGDPAAPDLDTLLVQTQEFAGQGDVHTVFSFFRTLEILTDSWAKRLAQVPASIQWDARLYSLAGYLIGHYWLQAVSDFDLVCRVKFIVTACILTAALGGDPVQTAQQFSKEIENDPDNVESLLDGAYTAPALTDANLFGILLG